MTSQCQQTIEKDPSAISEWRTMRTRRGRTHKYIVLHYTWYITQVSCLSPADRLVCKLQCLDFTHTHTHIGWRLGKCIWAQDHLVSIYLSQTTLNIGQTAKRFFSTAKISSWPKSSSLPKPSRENRNICLYSFRITAHVSYQIKMCISFRYLLYIQAFFNS